MTRDGYPETDEEVDFDNTVHLAYILDEHNKWRRGEGAYAWHEDPTKNVDFPFSVVTLGAAIDAAVEQLKAMSFE